MANIARDLYKAVFDELTAALSQTVYDAVPDDAAYPYVTLDRVVEGQEDYLNQRASRYIVTTAVWSRFRGQKEVLEIMGAIDDALHRDRLTLDSGRVAGAILTQTATSREPDNRTYQGQVIVEYLIEH